MKTKRHHKNRTLLAASAAIAAALVFAGCSTPDGFTIADTNKDGKVSPTETRRYVLEVIFIEGDANGDGKITFEEWKLANPDADKKKFDVADKNNDATITPAEAEAHFEKEGTLSDLFAKMDADSSGFVTREEASAFKNKLESQSGSSIQQLNKAIETP
jgi:Ca2+-binding EF-hand superfamily protein